MKTSKSTIATIAICVATAAALVVSANVGLSRHETAPTTDTTTTVVYAGVHLPAAVSRDIESHGGLNACPTEDSDNCYWDAVSRANNLGQSFVSWNGHFYYGPDITLAACDLYPQPAYTSIERCIDAGGNVVARDSGYAE